MHRAKTPIAGAITIVFLAFLALFASTFSTAGQAQASPLNPSDTCESVSWTAAANIAITGNSIQKTGGVPNTWDAGAISTRAILSGDGYVQATVDSTSSFRMFGLSNGDTNQGYGDIDFAAEFAGSTMMVYERGLYKGTFGSLAVGDVVRVAIENGFVNYYKNGSVVYTSAAQPTYPLLLDTAIYTSLGTISGAIICGTNIGNNVPTPTATVTRPAVISPTTTPLPSCEPVSFMNLINVTAVANSIQKTGGTPSRWDAGAVSTRAILSGDGYVQATVDSTGSFRMLGLSYRDNNAIFTDIDFAVYMDGNNFGIFEHGLNKGVYGNLSVGSIVKIAVESGIVNYYIDGALVYTSSMIPFYPLLLDTSINSIGGTLSAAYICGSNLGPNGLPSATATSTVTPSATFTPPPTNTATSTPTRTNTSVPPTRTFTATAPATNTATRTATNTPTSQPTSTPSAGSCQYFPSDNIWHRNIASLPVHPLSSNYLNSMGLSGALHANFGSGLWAGGPIGFPVLTVPGTQPRLPVSFTYASESDPGPYPVPLDAPIEGGPDSSGDRHVITVDRDNCTLYEMYRAFPQTSSWSAGSGARWQLGSNALRPDNWTSGDAAGLPILPSLVTYDEVQNGVIRHALRFTAPSTQRAHIWPARHHSSSNTDTNLPPMGLRLRLKANVDISVYPAQARVVLQALKDYGMILADNGDPWEIDGMPDERWNNNTLHMLGQLHGSDFEAIDESGLMIDPNSGQSR